MRPQRYYLILWFALATLFNGCALVLSSNHRTEDYAPVFAAATSGDLPTVREAVKRDPTLLKATEWDNATLLHDAVGQKHQDVAAYLLDKGADVNAVTKDGLTALHMAAQNGDTVIIRLLLQPERDTKIDPVDSKGWTPLDRALKWGHPDAADLLRQHGAHKGTSGR
jgi:ankyrin repeat protein